MHRIKNWICLLLVAMILGCVCPCFAQECVTVPVVLGGKIVANGVLENGRTLVPIQFLSEVLNYKVIWDAEASKVSVLDGDICNVLQIGSCVAERHLGATKYEFVLDVAPKIVQDRTYVPLRYITESFGCGVLWHSEERAVYLSPYTELTLENQKISMVHFTKEDVEAAFFSPYDVLHGADGIERYVYLRPESGNMSVLGFYENQLFEFFTNDISVFVNGKKLSTDAAVCLGDNAYVFCDSMEADKPVALFVSLGGRQYIPYKNEFFYDAVMAQEAKLAYYLTNSLRKKTGKADLIYSDSLANVDRKHTAWMAQNHILSHNGLDGEKFTDRLAKSGSYASYRSAGEILAKMPNAYYACYGWLNSEKHREAMLHSNYIYTGICVDGNLGENLYYAQVLIR